MGCFLGCFGGAKDHKSEKRRNHRASTQGQRNRVQNAIQRSTVTSEENVQKENTITVEDLITAPSSNKLVPELLDKPHGLEQRSPSPKKKVRFDANITTYEHDPVLESTQSVQEFTSNIEEEKKEDAKTSSQSNSNSISEDDNSVTSSVGSYPPNHRYHNARDSDDEAEAYGDSDLEDDLEDNFGEDDEDMDVRIAGQEVWSESVLTASMESKADNFSQKICMKQEVEAHGDTVKLFGSSINARDGDFVNSVLNPVENVTPSKAAKSREAYPLKPPPQKENLASNFEAPRMSFSSEPPIGQSPFISKKKYHQLKSGKQEVSVDASLSSWLASTEITPSRKTSLSGFETMSSGRTTDGCTSLRSYEDRPILGALTLDELKQISKSSPRKSPTRSPDDMPIIGTVGTYWNDSSSVEHSGSKYSFKGIPNTTSKYQEDKAVNWHSTPFETRLDRVLGRGAA